MNQDFEKDQKAVSDPKNQEFPYETIIPQDSSASKDTSAPVAGGADKASDSGSSDKKGSKTPFVVGAIIVIIIILLLLLRSCGGQPVKNNPFDLTPDANAADQAEGKSQEEIEAELNKKIADGMINISMNLTPVFETGTSEGNLLIVNDKSNNLPQVVEIYRNDTEELIYRSGAIEVGKEVRSGKLLVDMDPGTYDCVAYFNAINEETGELAGKAGANITITVEG